jgi:hypothetical protein
MLPNGKEYEKEDGKVEEDTGEAKEIGRTRESGRRSGETAPH